MSGDELNKLQVLWNQLQDLLDISGDVWLGIMTATVIFRWIYSALGHSPMTAAESAAYASAVTAFAYSNKGPKNG
jgi:hypothetical protein